MFINKSHLIFAFSETVRNWMPIITYAIMKKLQPEHPEISCMVTKRYDENSKHRQHCSMMQTKNVSVKILVNATHTSSFTVASLRACKTTFK